MGAPSTPSQPSSGHSLLRILGLGFGLAVIVGNTIGVGILRTPGEVAARVPSEAWFLGLWVAGGLYALLGALTLAELGAMIPESGGQYVFARRALGEYPGFVIGWSDWISTCGTLAAAAITIAEYAGVLLPMLEGMVVPVGAGIVLGFTALQWPGLRSGDLTQQLTSLLKTLALLALVAACFLLPGESASAPAAPPAATLTLAGLVVAAQGVIFTYDGWNGLLYFSGEVRDPGKEIPRAMAGGVVAVVLIYLSLILAFMYVLPLSRMAGETLVAGAAAEAVFGIRGDRILRGIMIVSLLSMANAVLMMGARTPWAMSRDGLLWAGATRVNAGGTPVVTLAASAALAIGFVLTGTFEQVLAVLAFFFVLNYTLSFVSLFVLRRREPELARPYRAFGFPWIAGLLLLVAVAFLVGTVVGDRANGLKALALLALSYPAYRLFARLRRGERTGA